MATEAQPATQAKRILVVEDEVMIRMLLGDMLGELGYTVAAEAARIDEALEATNNADFDLAILDANLNGQPVSRTRLPSRRSPRAGGGSSVDDKQRGTRRAHAGSTSIGSSRSLSAWGGGGGVGVAPGTLFISPQALCSACCC